MGAQCSTCNRTSNSTILCERAQTEYIENLVKLLTLPELCQALLANSNDQSACSSSAAKAEGQAPKKDETPAAKAKVTKKKVPKPKPPLNKWKELLF